MNELSTVSLCVGKTKAFLAAKWSPLRKGSQMCLSVRWVSFSSLSLCSKFFTVVIVAYLFSGFSSFRLISSRFLSVRFTYPPGEASAASFCSGIPNEVCRHIASCFLSASYLHDLIVPVYLASLGDVCIRVILTRLNTVMQHAYNGQGLLLPAF